LTVGPERQRLLDELVAAVERLAGVDRVHETLVEAPANVLLFIPIGFLLPWAFPRMPVLAAWLLCVLASVSVELTQLAFLPDRTPSVIDVATNAAGAGLGALFCAAVGWWRFSRSGSSRR
jgi:glycopeptide antibiotics resistance protein